MYEILFIPCKFYKTISTSFSGGRSGVGRKYYSWGEKANQEKVRHF